MADSSGWLMVTGGREVCSQATVDTEVAVGMGESRVVGVWFVRTVLFGDG